MTCWNDIFDLGVVKGLNFFNVIREITGGQEVPSSAVCKLENQESQWYKLVWVPALWRGGGEKAMV